MSESLSIEQLATQVGISVRNIRFYTSRGLIPPPRREGRNGFYGPPHIARLEFVRELQAHGFTLAAIEGYLGRIPADAAPEQVALHRALLAPWLPETREVLDRAGLDRRAGRSLGDADLELLAALGAISPEGSDAFRVRASYLPIGVQMIDLGLTLEVALKSQAIFTSHGKAVADELTDLFVQQIWPHYRESGESAEELRELVERFKPLTVQALVVAFESAVDDAKRETIRRRT